MYKQLNGILGQNPQKYNYKQQSHKYAAVPIKDVHNKINNAQKCSNPPYINMEQTISEFEQQRQSFSLTLKNKSKEFKRSYNKEEDKQCKLIIKRHQIIEINGVIFQLSTIVDQAQQLQDLIVIYFIFIHIDWCFIPAYICFLFAGIGIIILVMNNTTNIFNRILSLLVCGAQLISYLLVAISNPGIVQNKYQQKQVYTIESFTNFKIQQSQKYCKICDFRVPKSSYHCRDCDICIKGYDHHCPWTSKCIGQNNLSRFYFFLCMTPLFIVYIAVCFIMIMGEQTQSLNIHKIRQIFESQINLF